MIRISLISRAILPYAMRRVLEESSELKTVSQNEAEILLFSCSIWTRTELNELNETRGESSIPTVVICEKTQEPFGIESVLRGDISALIRPTATKEQFAACFQAVFCGFRTVQNSTVAEHSDARLSVLTARELEILRLIADGEGNKSIAHLLGISNHTVKFHISSIFEKLHVSSRTEAIRAGVKQGLIFI